MRRRGNIRVGTEHGDETELEASLARELLRIGMFGVSHGYICHLCVSNFEVLRLDWLGFFLD